MTARREAAALATFTEPLLAWYARRRRDLPWRRTRDPYRLLVSEVMLQQTQAARVADRYESFLVRFPGAAALAAATPAEVLSAWSGLGYNRRALALQQAARVVSRDGWPRDSAGLRRLPGVGPYTAAAVASFAWGEPVAAIDTNVRRVVERVDRRRHAPAALARRTARILPADRAADFNQAMIELGATVCTARAPACPRCPVAGTCRSRGLADPPRWRRRTTQPRFEETDRYLRGRVVAGLVAGAARLPEAVEAQRMERVLDGLERDGLVVRRDGRLSLPGAPKLPLG
jgi:A/G-specific adenine glycosylase